VGPRRASCPVRTELAPLLAAIAAAVRLDSKGPALYRQTRVGREERRFSLLKFRTMVVDAERLDEELMALSTDPDWLVVEGDPRVTRVGRLLRRTSLDEPRGSRCSRSTTPTSPAGRCGTTSASSCARSRCC
jgi:lipopolysaccharide/colanic/teichoic acid biosynthesis glycosyltransferase